MKPLPARVDLGHLKKQAKALIRGYRQADSQAIARFREWLPAAAGRSDAQILALGLRLHDAQSCIAREYAFASWNDLRRYVEVQSAAGGDRDARIMRWLSLVYAGDVTGSMIAARPRVAARILAEFPDLAEGAACVACACGDAAAIAQRTQRDPGWVNRAAGPLNLPPLIAVTYSSLVQLPQYREGLYQSARMLLAARADPNARIGNRWPPASLQKPDDRHPLSALYGAAGSNHDPVLTEMLLDAGADPNDGESLYHSLDRPQCTELLLRHGARIAGNNALYRALDLEDATALELLLANGADPNEAGVGAPLTEWGSSPLLWGLRRRRSLRHIQALLAAGADRSATTPSGVGAYRLALQFGLTDVAALLREDAAPEALSEEDRFVTACAGVDEVTARAIAQRRHDLPQSLSDVQLKLLPELAAASCDEAAMLMVELGWPIAVRGGDWAASALNHAVFRGDVRLTRFLLEHGASWRERQGFGDDVCGTLSWASLNEPVAGADWAGCARALREHGLPPAIPGRDDGDGDVVLIEGRSRRFSDDVTEVLLAQT